jgi:hypothetical protein
MDSYIIPDIQNIIFRKCLPYEQYEEVLYELVREIKYQSYITNKLQIKPSFINVSRKIFTQEALYYRCPPFY